MYLSLLARALKSGAVTMNGNGLMKRLIIILIVGFYAHVACASPWVIGLDTDLSSTAKAAGVAISQGAQLAIDEINSSGGILGEQVVLVSKDHRGNPARGLANIKSFSQNDRLLAVIGGVHTPVALAELPIIHQNSIIYLDPWAAGTPIVKNGYQPNYVFRLSIRDEWAGQVILNKAKQQGCESITLFLEQTGWGRSNEKSMSQASIELALPILNIEWFNWNSQILDKLVEKTVTDGSKCIAVVANSLEGADIIRAIANLDPQLRPKVFSHWGISSGDFTNRVGLDLLSNVELYYLQTLALNSPKTPVGILLKNNFETKYGKPVGHNSFNGAAHAYDLVHLLALAIKQSGSTESPKVRTALENLTTFKGAMKTYSKPFSAGQHEALDISDYLMLKFNNQGYGEVAQ
jgi:branched-chain amino acid transport system substrate-binding protein